MCPGGPPGLKIFNYIDILTMYCNGQTGITRHTRAKSIAIYILIFNGLQGCSTLDSMSAEEKIWQSLHLIDAAQTMSLKGDSCLEEVNYFTQRLIGKEPNTTEVATWWLGSAIAHYLISQALPPKFEKVWQYVTIGAVGYTVVDNHNTGMRPFGINQNDNGCN